MCCDSFRPRPRTTFARKSGFVGVLLPTCFDAECSVTLVNHGAAMGWNPPLRVYPRGRDHGRIFLHACCRKDESPLFHPPTGDGGGALVVRIPSTRVLIGCGRRRVVVEDGRRHRSGAAGPLGGGARGHRLK